MADENQQDSVIHNDQQQDDDVVETESTTRYPVNDEDHDNGVKEEEENNNDLSPSPPPSPVADTMGIVKTHVPHDDEGDTKELEKEARNKEDPPTASMVLERQQHKHEMEPGKIRAVQDAAAAAANRVQVQHLHVLPSTPQVRYDDPAHMKAAVGLSVSSDAASNIDNDGTNNQVNETVQLAAAATATATSASLTKTAAKGDGSLPPSKMNDATTTGMASTGTHTTASVTTLSTSNTTATAGTSSPPPTELRRQSHNDARTMSRPPGAVAVFPQGNHRDDDTDVDLELQQQQLDQQQSSGSQGPVTSPPPPMESSPSTELLLNATLVDPEAEAAEAASRQFQNTTDNDVIIEAEPAPEGFKAIVANKQFKYLVGVFLAAIIIAIVIPVAILVPQRRDDNNNGMELLNSTEVCGTLETNQQDYRGTINVTESGKVCQRWDRQEPHSHNYLPGQFKDGGLEENYCRNPEGDARTWCYTMENLTRWEWCDVPYCGGWKMTFQQDCGSMSLRQEDYRGTMAITATGKTCQVWDSDFPHFHVRTSDRHPNAGLENNNYCRNPIGYSAAFCYTMENDTEWEYCDIPACESRTNWFYHDDTCENCTTQQCGSESVKQRDYRGTINTTVSGRECQRWDEQSPQRHAFTPELKRLSGLEDNNYCRNPDGSAAAWCFTTDPLMRSELCEVPYCPEPFLPRRDCGTLSKSQSDYRGDIKTSLSGLECIAWEDSADAVSLGYTHEKLPIAGLVDAFCRNPAENERGRAWCFVAGAAEPWAYCDVPDCQECGTVSQKKVDYRGTESVTINGTTCVNWKDKEQELLDLNVTIDYLGELEENFCRNVDGIRDNVWCFVDSDSSEWQYCEVPDCTDDPNMPIPTNDTCGSAKYHQADYRGPINVTATGRTCQRWSSQEPHPHKFKPEDRPMSGLDDNNSCRNPSGDDSIGAWCYTTDEDVQWEYCHVPVCEAHQTQLTVNTTCGTLSQKQKDYRGTINITVSGIACQRWDSQEPHPHRFPPDSLSTAGLAENWCRNPDDSARAWCYTSDPDVLYDYCDVPECDEEET